MEVQAPLNGMGGVRARTPQVVEIEMHTYAFVKPQKLVSMAHNIETDYCPSHTLAIRGSGALGAVPPLASELLLFSGYSLIGRLSGGGDAWRPPRREPPHPIRTVGPFRVPWVPRGPFSPWGGGGRPAGL